MSNLNTDNHPTVRICRNQELCARYVPWGVNQVIDFFFFAFLCECRGIIGQWVSNKNMKAMELGGGVEFRVEKRQGFFFINVS